MLLIFDLDGTLIDSRSCIVKATQRAFEEHGLLVPEEAVIVNAMGTPIEVTFPVWSGLDDVEALKADYRQLYREVSETELTIFKGIPEALEFLSKEHTLAIATSKKRSVAEHNLDVCGLRHYFKYIVGSDDVQNYKPHPESIYKILSQHRGKEVNGSKRHWVEAWMIGDTRMDIEMGEAAEVATCFVMWGSHSLKDIADMHPPTSNLQFPQEFHWLFGDGICGSFLHDMTIRTWNESDSVEQITELLHLAYGELAKKGMHYNASHQPPSQTLERLKGGDSFVAVVDDLLHPPEIIGTITLYQSSPNSGHPYYQRPGLVYFGQFGVHPKYQGYGVAKKLYQTVEDHARSIGATEIALDTAETAHDLIALYKRWGFEIVDTADWDSTNYISVIMAKKLNCR